MPSDRILIVRVPDVPDDVADHEIVSDTEASLSMTFHGVTVAVAEQVGWAAGQFLPSTIHTIGHEADDDTLTLRHSHCVPVYREAK